MLGVGPRRGLSKCFRYQWQGKEIIRQWCRATIGRHSSLYFSTSSRKTRRLFGASQSWNPRRRKRNHLLSWHQARGSLAPVQATVLKKYRAMMYFGVWKLGKFGAHIGILWKNRGSPVNVSTDRARMLYSWILVHLRLGVLKLNYKVRTVKDVWL